MRYCLSPIAYLINTRRHAREVLLLTVNTCQRRARTLVTKLQDAHCYDSRQIARAVDSTYICISAHVHFGCVVGSTQWSRPLYKGILSTLDGGLNYWKQLLRVLCTSFVLCAIW